MRDVPRARSGAMSPASREASLFCLGCKFPGQRPCCPGLDISDSTLRGFMRWRMASEVVHAKFYKLVLVKT